MRNFQPVSRRISETVQDMTQFRAYYDGLIWSRICAFDWHQGRWPWMTLNCYKFEFSQNFALLRIFGRQKPFNEWRQT